MPRFYFAFKMHFNPDTVINPYYPMRVTVVIRLVNGVIKQSITFIVT